MNDLKMMYQILRSVSLREWLEALAFAALLVVMTIGALIIGG